MVYQHTTSKIILMTSHTIIKQGLFFEIPTSKKASGIIRNTTEIQLVIQMIPCKVPIDHLKVDSTVGKKTETTPESSRNPDIMIEIPVINPRIAKTFEHVTTLQQQQQNFL